MTKLKTIDNMKKITITLIAVLAIMAVYAENQTISSSSVSVRPSFAYQLFPTKNRFIFIRLDTRNGLMMQVDVLDESQTAVLNSTRLVRRLDELNGRFSLYPTENMFIFILLDKTNGRMWRVEWGMEDENRSITPIPLN